MTFDPRLICQVLNDEGVDYVVLGGFAAAIHGSPLPTSDVDVTFTPAGPRLDYADWHERAGEVEIADGLTVRVASLDDVISSKRAAGRDKDLHALPYLESLRDELKGREDLA